MRRMWSVFKSFLLPVLGILGLIFALMLVLNQKDPPPNVPIIPPPSTVYTNSIAGIGVIEPKSELIAIGTELSGVVRQVHVEPGQVVQAGEPLFSLDQRDVESQLQILKASLAVAQVQAEDAATQFALVENLKDNRAVSKDDYNRRFYGAQSSQARVKELQARLDQAQTTLRRLTVTAPLAGTVLEVNLRPGEFATAGALAQPFMRMGDLSTLHLRVELDEEEGARFSRATSAKGSLRGNPEKAYPLTFVRVEPYVRPKRNLLAAGQRVDTRVLEVIYALPPETQGLWVGQQMDVYIQERPQGRLK